MKPPKKAFVPEFDFPELWKAVVGYEGVYEVSNWGRVRRIGQAFGATVGRILKASQSRYMGIHLQKNDERPRSVRVHTLVHEAFSGPIPPGLVINHKDGNRYNNSPQNLELVTHAENIAHAIEMGLNEQRGEHNHLARLDEAVVRKILALYATRKCGYIKIARMFGIASGHVRDIVKGKAWNHIRQDSVVPLAPEEVQLLLDQSRKPRKPRPAAVRNAVMAKKPLILEMRERGLSWQRIANRLGFNLHAVWMVGTGRTPNLEPREGPCEEDR